MFKIVDLFTKYIKEEYKINFNNYIILNDLFHKNDYKIIFIDYNVNYDIWKNLINKYPFNKECMNIEFDSTEYDSNWDDDIPCWSIPKFVNDENINDIFYYPIYYIKYSIINVLINPENNLKSNISDLFITYINNTKHINFNI